MGAMDVLPCLRGDGAAGACREGTSGGVSCLTGDGTAGACREVKGDRVSYPGEEAVYQASVEEAQAVEVYCG